MDIDDLKPISLKTGDIWFYNAAGVLVFVDEYGREFTSKAEWRKQRRIDRRAAGFQLALSLDNNPPEEPGQTQD